MFAAAMGPTLAGHPLLPFFFAIRPEPDLEFTEEELEQTAEQPAPAPAKPPKPSGGRPLLWLVLLAVLGGGAYVAMEPEMVLDWVNQLTGEQEATAPPLTPMAKAPAPTPAPGSAPAPVAPGTQATPGTTPPGPMSAAPQAAPPSGPAVPITPPSPATAPKSAAPAVPSAAPAQSGAIPSPNFGEGQRVTIALEPGAVSDTVTLFQDAAGTKPATSVRPGVSLTVLDGDLQASGWVYQVRSDDGAKGWISEKRLRLKP